MRAIGRDEVDQRLRVLQVEPEVGPAGVGLQRRVAARVVIEHAARVVQPWNAGVPGPRHVDGRQVQRKAEQVVAQRVGDELVELVADLLGHAAHDVAGRIDGTGAAGIELQRVQERFDQPDLGEVAGVVDAIHGLGQHRVSEAVHHVRELGHDGGVDGAVVADEDIHLGLHLARELLEHQMLVLHLGAEARRLEHALAVPVQGVDHRLEGGQVSRVLRVFRDGRQHRHCGHLLQQPLIQVVHVAGFQRDPLDVTDQAVVLGMEHRVHGGQADVLVAAAIAGDEVLVEQLVVVGAAGLRIADDAVAIWVQYAGQELRRRVMGDVVKEGVAGTHGAGSADRGQRVAFDEGVRDSVSVEAGDELRKPVRARDELAVGIGEQQRHVADIGVGELDAKHRRSLGLDLGPVADAASGAVDQSARRHRVAGGVQFVLAQEDLVRGMRGVGLVLVDERRRCVGVLVDVVFRAQDAIVSGLVGGARQHHERVGLRFIAGIGNSVWAKRDQRVVEAQGFVTRVRITVRPMGDQRVVGSQRDEHRA